MKKNFFLFLALLASTLSASAARWNAETKDWSRNPKPVVGDWGMDRPGYPKGLYIHGITVREGRAVKNAVIYDNDVYNDVLDDEWMFAMASLGRMRLVGQIVTPVYSEKWQFYWPWWVHTAFTAMERARASGIDMRRLPPITVGTEAETEREAEGKASDGARLYVELINKEYRRNPQLPVIVNIGGQAATLASAWCIDPTIADKCIVYYTDIETYNGNFRWASDLVARHFRVVDFGSDKVTWGSRLRQDEWTVLPRPEHAEAADNDAWSGEWRQLSEKHIPLLDWYVHQLRHRKELSQVGWKSDGYCDGTFMHAWLPGMFSGAELKGVRSGEGEGASSREVLRITKFGRENEALVKEFALSVLLDERAYGKVSQGKAEAKGRKREDSEIREFSKVFENSRKLSKALDGSKLFENLENLGTLSPFTFSPSRPLPLDSILLAHKEGRTPLLVWRWTATTDATPLLAEGTAHHRALWNELRQAALLLRELPIPVLWQPLPPDGVSLSPLWQAMHQYFTLTHSLRNLIWLSPERPGEPFSPAPDEEWLTGGFF